MVAKGGTADIAPDLLRMKLYQEAMKDLPCKLPATGRGVMRRFEEKNGQMETWKQKEVVVKYDDVKMNSI